MRRNLLKRKIALELSLLMLGSNTSTWAESVQTSELAQETQGTAVEELIFQADGENQEAVTEELEVSAQVETLTAETEAAQYPEEVSIYPQENLTTAAEVVPETVLESTIDSILLEESVESTEIQTSTEDLKAPTEESSEHETESEAETELESEVESESETQELESFEESETEGYLEDALVYGDFKYQVSKSQATIVEYLGSSSIVTIPDTIGEYPVTTIGNRAFYQNETLTNVTLPKSLTIIGDSAFANSGLTSIVIPGSVTSVGTSAFAGSKLVSAVFTDGDEYTKATLGNGVFENCERLETVDLSENITNIGNKLIYNTKVTSITIPKNVK